VSLPACEVDLLLGEHALDARPDELAHRAEAFRHGNSTSSSS
jgi:hypothetical protein